jgi:pilus assembly protein Flp/PilA
MARLLRTFLTNDDGATAIEYGILAAVMSVVIVGSTGSIRFALINTFNKINTNIASVN